MNAIFTITFIYVLVEQATLKNNGIFKPNPYVDITIDGNHARKTEIVKHSYMPAWNESFTVCVTPTSEITFRVLDRSSFLKDSLLGERNLHLAQILECYHGRCDNLELVLDLLGSLKPEGRIKCGELTIVLNGLRIENMGSASNQNQITNGTNNALNTTGSIASASVDANLICNGRSIILSGGIRARVRGSPVNNNSSNSATSSAVAESSFGLTSTRNSNDTRNIRLSSNSDSVGRRYNEFNDDAPQQQLSRSVNNLGTSSVSYISNPNRANWDSNQTVSSCNGLSPQNQRNQSVSCTTTIWLAIVILALTCNSFFHSIQRLLRIPQLRVMSQYRHQIKQVIPQQTTNKMVVQRLFRMLVINSYKHKRQLMMNLCQPAGK